jgi:hypothetical protein
MATMLMPPRNGKRWIPSGFLVFRMVPVDPAMCCLALSCNLSVSPDRQEWADSRGRCHGPYPWFNLAGEEGVGEPHGRSQKAQWPDVERHKARAPIRWDVEGAVANPQTAGLIGLSGFDDVYGCHCHSAPQGQFVERDLEPSGLIAGQQNGPVPFPDLERDVG